MSAKTGFWVAFGAVFGVVAAIGALCCGGLFLFFGGTAAVVGPAPAPQMPKVEQLPAEPAVEEPEPEVAESEPVRANPWLIGGPAAVPPPDLPPRPVPIEAPRNSAREARAASLLRLAKTGLEVRESIGMRRLKELIDDYPETQAAREAKTLLRP